VKDGLRNEARYAEITAVDSFRNCTVLADTTTSEQSASSKVYIYIYIYIYINI